jgi:protein-tyrosine phosphatase
MIDIHTHILPYIDDGAEDIEDALKALKLAQDSGVTDIFLTPHYMPGEYDNTKTLIRGEIKLLREAALEESIGINLISGIEVYLTQMRGKMIDFDKFRMADSDYVLVETAMHGFPINLFDMLYQMVKDGLRPILAHPERYIDIMKNINIAEELIHRNVYLQANAGSFLGEYGSLVTSTVWEMFHHGYIHFIASDHHCRTDSYSLATLENLLRENYTDVPVKKLMCDNPARILRNEPVEFLNPEIQPIRKDRDTESLFHRLLRIINNG